MDRSLVYNQFIFSKHISTFKLSTRPISPLSHSIILRNYFSPWLTPWIAANGKDRLLGACSNTSTLKFHINLQKKTVRGGTKQKVKGKIRGQSVFCCSSEGDTRIFEFRQRAFNSYAFFSSLCHVYFDVYARFSHQFPRWSTFISKLLTWTSSLFWSRQILDWQLHPIKLSLASRRRD